MEAAPPAKYSVTVDSIEKLVSVLNKYDFAYPSIIGLVGELGAGKTELVRQFVRQQGGDTQDVVSPTYSLHNSYPLADGKLAHHFDFYRLNTEDELNGIGFWDFLQEPAYFFVEWPRWIDPKYLPWPYLEVEVTRLGVNERKLVFRPHEKT